MQKLLLFLLWFLIISSSNIPAMHNRTTNYKIDKSKKSVQFSPTNLVYDYIHRKDLTEEENFASWRTKEQLNISIRENDQEIRIMHGDDYYLLKRWDRMQHNQKIYRIINPPIISSLLESESHHNHLYPLLNAEQKQKAFTEEINPYNNPARIKKALRSNFCYRCTFLLNASFMAIIIGMIVYTMDDKNQDLIPSNAM